VSVGLAPSRWKRLGAIAESSAKPATLCHETAKYEIQSQFAFRVFVATFLAARNPRGRAIRC
jgi:hypothetical protein